MMWQGANIYSVNSGDNKGAGFGEPGLHNPNSVPLFPGRLSVIIRPAVAAGSVKNE